MLKKAAALLLVCASMAIWVSCGSTSSRYLYAAIPASNQIVAYREDPNSGVLTQLVGSPISAGQAVQSLVIHPSKKFLYAANSGEGDVSLFTISSRGRADGSHAAHNSAGLSRPRLLAMDSAGSFLYVGNSGSFNISVFSIDSGTGAMLTAVGTSLSHRNRLPSTCNCRHRGRSLRHGSEATTRDHPGLHVQPGCSQSSGPELTISPRETSPYGLAIAPGGGFLYTGQQRWTIPSRNSRSTPMDRSVRSPVPRSESAILRARLRC